MAEPIEVSTEEFDAQQLQQDDLKAPTRLRGAEAPDRGIGTRPELPAGEADWSTAEIIVTTVHPAEPGPSAHHQG